MHTFFDTAPVAAVESMFDGHQYLFSTKEMYLQSDGRFHVRERTEPRMMRVSHEENGVAYVKLGKAGDAIACIEGLPSRVISIHTHDNHQLVH